MTVASFFRELYSLDTLDTRFTTSSSTPLKAIEEHPRKPVERDGKAVPTDVFPPQWRTPEFYFYALVFLFCVPQMYWAVVEVSQRKIGRLGRYHANIGNNKSVTADSPNYSKYEPLLSPGWLFGRKVVRWGEVYVLVRKAHIEHRTIQTASMPAFGTISHI